MWFFSVKWMAAENKTFASAAELTILLTNIGILEDSLKITQKQLDELNTRIENELNAKPFNSYHVKLLNILLDQHKIVINQFNDEIKLKTDFKTRFANELEKKLSAKAMSMDANGNLTINRNEDKSANNNINNNNNNKNSDNISNNNNNNKNDNNHHNNNKNMTQIN